MKKAWRIFVTVLAFVATFVSIFTFYVIIPNNNTIAYKTGIGKFDSVLASGKALQKKSSDSTVAVVWDSVKALNQKLMPPPKKVFKVKKSTEKIYTADEIKVLQEKRWAETNPKKNEDENDK